MEGEGDPDEPSIWIKHAEGKIACGDTVYCVRIADGRLRLFARVEVKKTAHDDGDPSTLLVWATPDGYAGWPDGLAVDDNDADALVYLHGDGSPHPMKRHRGRLTAHAFQGIASLRELDEGHQLLDRLAVREA